MKIGISGKGGSGKTTISATLARVFARQGFPVLAIDGDPNPNLDDCRRRTDAEKSIYGIHRTQPQIPYAENDAARDGFRVEDTANLERL